MNPIITAYLSKNGRKGGKVSSPAKAAAARANARKPRPRKVQWKQGASHFIDPEVAANWSVPDDPDVAKLMEPPRRIPRPRKEKA